MAEEPRVLLPARPAFSKEEKAALVLLIIAGMGGLFFGFRYMGKNLQMPFSFSYSGPQYLSANEQEAAQIDELKARDTDADGLNDYDERYVYKTSAYLSDSDGDGTSDQTEIASGGDPNCPIGKTCTGSASVDATADASDTILNGVTAPVAPDLGAAQEALDTASADGTSINEQDVINNMTPDQLRDLLISNGADEAQVRSLTDAQLMELYTQVLQQYQAGASTTTP